MKYGERLKMARIRAGLTQQALADRVGMKQPSLAYLENAAKNAGGSEYTVKLSRILGVSVDWLDDEIGEMTPKVYSTSDPHLVEILKALEPRAEYLKDAAYKAVLTTIDLVDHASQAVDPAAPINIYRPPDQRHGLHFYGGHERRQEKKNEDEK